MALFGSATAQARARVRLCVPFCAVALESLWTQAPRACHHQVEGPRLICGLYITQFSTSISSIDGGKEKLCHESISVNVYTERFYARVDTAIMR